LASDCARACHRHRRRYCHRWVYWIPPGSDPFGGTQRGIEAPRPPWLPALQDTSRAAEPRSKVCRRGLRWALEGLVVGRLTIARIADWLALSWNTANSSVLAEGKRVLIDDPHRFDGVKVVGADEHVWRHTRRGDKYVTVVIEFTPIREVRGRRDCWTWLAEREKSWRAGVEVVTMDGFTGFRTATTEELPDAVAVMDPFHAARLADEALDQCRRCVQQDLHCNRGRNGDPLYTSRRTLHTGADLLTDKQTRRRQTLFAVDEHVLVEAPCGIYQRMITAYREPERAKRRQLMEA